MTNKNDILKRNVYKRNKLVLPVNGKVLSKKYCAGKIKRCIIGITEILRYNGGKNEQTI